MWKNNIVLAMSDTDENILLSHISNLIKTKKNMLEQTNLKNMLISPGMRIGDGSSFHFYF